MTPPLDLEHAEQPTPVELQSLRRVFQHINTSNNGKLSSGELHDVLVSLGHPTNKQDIELMIWEVDDDLDQYISWDEFLVMYQRCINDATGLEPRKLFNLVQFLMYDRDFTGSISVEQTLQILFVRYGRELLDQEIQAIFGEEEKDPDGQEKRIPFSEYLNRVTERLTKQRNTKKGVTYPKVSLRGKRPPQTMADGNDQ
eukprot:GHVQ01005063.1.p1 GENE.GHVQ01005063.1~~GHVQ01005063.1.p1  ORF type:complete len:199 (-),score=19.27 GHVQ01005063.1:380-976(-)